MILFSKPDSEKVFWEEKDIYCRVELIKGKITQFATRLSSWLLLLLFLSRILFKRGKAG